jgi:hypothetical protein
MDIFDLYLHEFDKPWVITSGKLAVVLQTSALGGPTLSTRIEACVDITVHRREPFLFIQFSLIAALACSLRLGGSILIFTFV